MLGRIKTQRLKENAVSASEIALLLAQDKKFRKRLLSAIEHGSQARRRTRRGLSLTATIGRLARDQTLQTELRAARNDLQGAYRELEAMRRKRALRRSSLLAALALLAAIPELRRRASSMIARAPKPPQQITDLANRVRPGGSNTGRSHPGTLEDLTREELYARAQAADIPGRSEMSKQQLVEALRART
jgi:hypothetical protein